MHKTGHVCNHRYWVCAEIAPANLVSHCVQNLWFEHTCMRTCKAMSARLMMFISLPFVPFHQYLRFALFTSFVEAAVPPACGGIVQSHHSAFHAKPCFFLAYERLWSVTCLRTCTKCVYPPPLHSLRALLQSTVKQSNLGLGHCFCVRTLAALCIASVRAGLAHMYGRIYRPRSAKPR